MNGVGRGLRGLSTILLSGLLAVAGALLPEPAQAAGATLSKSEIRQAEQALKDLGYWTGPVDGVWDEATRHALVAFQKVERARATGTLTRAEWNALSVAATPRPKQKGPAHIEVDLARQVLFLVDDDGRVGNILPVSSGNGKKFKAGSWIGDAVTPCGRFEVFSRVSGWRTSALGEMHNPLYIVGGIAIHGSLSVPAKPASHGCIRIPMFASERLHRLVPRNMPVLVYGCAEEPRLPDALAGAVAAAVPGN
jgi:hypothetical protein